MIIRAIKLRALTNKGYFGFFFEFDRNLTIIRANNSSGKSTLFNSLLYGLGMEELIGGKDTRVLNSAVKEHLEYGETRVAIAASEVLLEIENDSGHIVTLRRPIKDEVRGTKLVEVFKCAHLTQKVPLGIAMPTYLHDAGAAQRQEGFHRFLEGFLGLNLPRVPTTGGGDAKLYLQAVFAAVAVEQKRGWTDYAANIPFFGIRDARTRVVEFILGLNVFETNALRNKLDSEAVAIDQDWRRAYDELRRDAAALGVSVDGVSNKPDAIFQQERGILFKQVGTSAVSLPEYISQLRAEHVSLEVKAREYGNALGADVLKEVDAGAEELQRLSLLHERATSALTMQCTSLQDYENLLKEASDDLDRNKTAKKLRDLGAQYALELAVGACPTCHQAIDDSLLRESVSGRQMDLETNIEYLDSQCRMLKRQVTGLKESIRASQLLVGELAARLAAKRDYLIALRGDLSNGATESKATVRRQVQIDVEVEGLQKLEERSGKLFGVLQAVAKRLADNQLARKALPKEYYSDGDLARLRLFEMMFRANAQSFGYTSARIEEIEINKDNLTPCLAQMELREIIRKAETDSSASDFVRLIWSYLLALYQTSAHRSSPGHHPGILLFDEPGQHSMRDSSQRALLAHMAAESGLQSIVAASFEENESVFRAATANITFKLISWQGKLLQPLDDGVSWAGAPPALT